MVGTNFSHLPKVCSLFTKLFFTAKVYFFDGFIEFPGGIRVKSRVHDNQSIRHKSTSLLPELSFIFQTAKYSNVSGQKITDQ